MKLFEREGVNNNWVLSDSMGMFVQVQFCEGFGDYWEAWVDFGSAMPGSCETSRVHPGMDWLVLGRRLDLVILEISSNLGDFVNHADFFFPVVR